MSKHMPGPYTPQEIASSTGSYWAILTNWTSHDENGSPGEVVAVVYGGQAARANAHLLAAAPDTYAACVGLLNAIHDSMTHESQRFHAAQIDAARAAIASATGAGEGKA